MLNDLNLPIGRLAALPLLAASLLLGSAANAAPNRVDVCHVPTDTPENTQLISVGGNGGAVADHLSHGDWLATTPKCDDINDNDCDGETDDPELDRLDCVDQKGNADAFCGAGTCLEPVVCPCFDVADLETLESECDDDAGDLIICNLSAVEASAACSFDSLGFNVAQTLDFYVAQTRTDIPVCELLDSRDNNPDVMDGTLTPQEQAACRALLEQQFQEIGFCDIN